MSALPKTRLNALQYLAIENAAEFRSEFFDGEVFAMAGDSSATTLSARTSSQR